MDLDTFHGLLTPQGQTALQEAAALQPTEADFLSLFDKLKRRYPVDLARAALETAILRIKAFEKFPSASNMYFTREALEQATSFTIASYRADRYRSFTSLVDLGCSIGGDTLALAKIAPTLGVDLDPLRLAMAQTNTAVLDLGQRVSFLQADLTLPLPLNPSADLALFFDPARRTDFKRAYSVHAYRPSLDQIAAWLKCFPAIGVKISPGVDLGELGSYSAEIEFISLHGALKEAVLWFGPLKGAERRATLLPGPYTLASKEDFDNPAEMSLPLVEPQDFIFEPDPAVLRAGLVQDLGQQLGAAQLDPDIAYLTSNRRIHTPFGRCWTVEAWFPFQLKRLREALRQRQVGQVTIKKRGSPLQPEQLITQLRLSGSEKRVVFLTHLRGRPIVIIAYDEITRPDRDQ